MFNQKVTTADVITVILTTAMSAGGFYLLGFILSFFVVSPLGSLLAILLLNVLNIWYHFSKYYKRVFFWVNLRVELFIDNIKSKEWFIKLSDKTSSAYNYVITSKPANCIRIAYYWSAIKVLKGISTVKGLFTKSTTNAKFVSPAVNATVAN